MLAVEELSALLFNSSSGNQLLYSLNSQLRSLIENDKSLLSENSTSPTLWECKWLNDQTVDGYKKGAAVWMNTQSPYSVLNTRYDQVMQYINENGRLKTMMSRIDTSDQSKVNEFMLKAIEGTANSNVSAIYCLGSMSDPVQIRVSKTDNNKTLPTDDANWYDFYKRSTMESNISSMMVCLSGLLSSSLSVHEDRYHLSSLTESQMDSYGFFKKSPFQISSIQTQHFYDHNYCEHMEGFDYVVNWQKNANSWCREWKSGYIEQGGFVENTGNALIDVSFLASYNYPIGQKFYQDRYDKLAGESGSIVACSVASSNRYVFYVTPILKQDAATAYSTSPITRDESKAYACVDVTNMSNNGFSIVNLDTSANKYAKYSWHVAGYAIR